MSARFPLPPIARIVPLLPSESFVLHVGPGVKRSRRFIRIFGSVWPRIPAGARHCLIATWYPQSAARVCPYFFLVRELSFRDGRPATGLFLTDHRYGWDAPTLDRVDEDLAAALIAHELAHGVLYAAEGNASNEEAVDQVVSDWGWGPAMREARRRQFPPVVEPC